MSERAGDTSPIESSPAGPLDYAPAPPRRKKLFRRLALLGVILVVSVVGWKRGPRAWEKTKFLYLQRQCMNYSPGAEIIVYEDEPAAAAALLAKDSQYKRQLYRYYRSPNPTVVTAAAFVPGCWIDYCSSIPTLSTDRSSLPRTYTSTFSFMHERTAPSGDRQLVCVDFDPYVFDVDYLNGFVCFAYTITPATFTSPSRSVERLAYHDVRDRWPYHLPNIRVFAGQPDPADASHFTIRYEMWGQTDTLDGWLVSPDHVTIKARKRPIEPPSKPVGGPP